jgi:hypothetical protein
MASLIWFTGHENSLNCQVRTEFSMVSVTEGDVYTTA